MASPIVDILMYHSISDNGGPTAISPAVFSRQMATIAEAGIPVIRLDDLVAAGTGGASLPAQSIILTFDDGFQDFADTAFPILDQYKFPVIVYLPIAHVGLSESWWGSNTPARQLLGWNTVHELASAGVVFGSHSMSHPDLCSLSSAMVSTELTRSREVLEDRLAKKITHFAPPYGRTTVAVRVEIALQYQTSVGTRLCRAKPTDDPYNLPRLEMHYFRNAAVWRNHLHNRGGPYIAARQILRKARNLVLMPWEKA